MNAEKLRFLGWTIETARERMAQSRRDLPTYRAITTSARYSYRVLNACNYLRHRSIIRILSTP